MLFLPGNVEHDPRSEPFLSADSKFGPKCFGPFGHIPEAEAFSALAAQLLKALDTAAA